jgi:hypothetical protein
MRSDPEFESGSEEIQLVTVFVTGKIIQFDMAVDALKQARIPFQSQEETGTGLKFSMPVAPTPGPGTFWSILVPEKASAGARQVLSQLPFPITTSPGPWDFLPPETSEEARADVRGQRWIFSIGFLLFSAIPVAIGCMQLATGGHRDRGDAIAMIVTGLVMMAIVGGLILHSWRWLERHPEPGKIKGLRSR